MSKTQSEWFEIFKDMDADKRHDLIEAIAKLQEVPEFWQEYGWTGLGTVKAIAEEIELYIRQLEWEESMKAEVDFYDKHNTKTAGGEAQ